MPPTPSTPHTLLRAFTWAAALLALNACAITTHPTQPSSLGRRSSGRAMESALDAPGPIVVETVLAADWALPRGGPLNLDHPQAKSAGLGDGDEPIQIFFHALRHPKFGLFLIDTGVERALARNQSESALGWLLRSYAQDAFVLRAPCNNRINVAQHGGTRQ